jgi:two-component system KDP operon response regulator KdpE
MHRVLVVDDDPKIRKLVKVNLERRESIVSEASDGAEAISIMKQQMPDLVLLDLVMPGISGIDVCIWIRAQSDVPVIVLSAYDEEELKVRALDAGADDYVAKPFGYEELLARMRAVMRRASGEVRPVAGPKVEIGGLAVDLEGRRVFVGGIDVPLTRTEFALLAELATNLDAILSHEELLTKVWGPECRDESHYLHIYFGRIRKKLGTKHSQLLETVPGVGYLLRSSP